MYIIMSDFLQSTISLLAILLLAWGIHIISKKIKLPYTILLFVAGLLLWLLSLYFPWLWWITALKLSPDLLLYIFLPVLLFESCYNMKLSELYENKYSIGFLAIFGLLISAWVIALLSFFVFQWIGMPIPWQICLLFGSIISSTDPVAVLALFKEYGAPKKLSLLFEGESCFNDWTWLALFLIVYEIIRTWVFNSGMIWEGILQFIIMIWGGAVLGFIIGLLFAEIIKRVKNNEPVEIILTLVLAHFAFIFAELIGHYVHIGWFEVHISWVITTVMAASVMGSYGRSKISPSVEKYMHKFWWFFGFVCNSLVFFMMWSIAVSLGSWNGDIIIATLVFIVVTIIARGLSVYLPVWLLNKLKLERYIPMTRQHLLARWSLRWALVLIMCLLIDDNLTIAWWTFENSPKEFITLCVLWAIIFTLIIKANTMPLIIKKFKLDIISPEEQFQKHLALIHVNRKELDKLEQMHDHYTIAELTYLDMKQELQSRFDDAQMAIQWLVKTQPEDFIVKMLSLEAVGVASYYLKQLFANHEVDETNYLYLMDQYDHQREEIAADRALLHSGYYHIYKHKTLTFYLTKFFNFNTDSSINKYIRKRTQRNCAFKVIRELQEMKTRNIWIEDAYFDEVIAYFEKLFKRYEGKIELYSKELQTQVSAKTNQLLWQWVDRRGKIALDDMLAKWLIEENVHQSLS